MDLHTDSSTFFYDSQSSTDFRHSIAWVELVHHWMNHRIQIDTGFCTFKVNSIHVCMYDGDDDDDDDVNNRSNQLSHIIIFLLFTSIHNSLFLSMFVLCFSIRSNRIGYIQALLSIAILPRYATGSTSTDCIITSHVFPWRHSKFMNSTRTIYVTAVAVAVQSIVQRISIELFCGYWFGYCSSVHLIISIMQFASNA